MKVDLITVAAVGVAVLAVATWARNRRAAAVAPSVGSDFYAMLTQQRRDSGAAMPANTDYLRYWDTSPMASTIYSNGSLGD